MGARRAGQGTPPPDPSGPGRPRRPGPAEGAREALLTAGTELFAEHGFEGVRVEAVARRAGVNKAMINYHFGGKRGLYEAILTTTFEEIVAKVAPLRTSRRPAPELLSEFCAMFAELATVRRPSFPALLLRELVSGPGTPRFGPSLVVLLGTVAAVVERGVREGDFRPVDPVATHLGLVGTLVFFFATEPVRRRLAAEHHVRLRMPSPESFCRHVEEMTLRGLAPEAAPRRPHHAR